MRASLSCWLCFAAVVFTSIDTSAQTFERPQLRAERASTPPVIDGTLDDQSWQGEPIPAGEWLSYNPLPGERVPQHTSVWMTYDENHLYFAFKADDPSPSDIKTSVTRRDNIWQDDWIGLSLDALGTGQQAYHMMVNPSGVQLDMVQSAAGGEDSAPDWIWDSAGKVTATGYAVEIRLPLQSIRLKGGQNARMGILFWRRVSRLGMSVAWPALTPGSWVFERHASLHFDDIRPQLAQEVLPSITYARASRRSSPTAWSEADSRADVGLSAKVGLTSTITLDATVNPDFSQVESDAFQVEVNQRFPIFFGEKRPFFMEGAGIFRLAGAGGDGSFRTAVHTRRIIDPIFGAKLTGSVGRLTFGTLTALDESAGRDLPPEVRGSGGNRLFNIGRVQYSLGPSNYVGAIVTDASFAGSYNRVVGTDLRWRVSESQRLEAFALVSRSRESENASAATGLGAQINYSYDTQKWLALGSVEHYGSDFEMATAFMNRVGITSGWAFIARNFDPDNTKHPWVRRISITSFSQGGSDAIAGGGDFITLPGLRFNLTRQGFIGVQRSFGFEHWKGLRFERGRYQAFGNAQVFRWLNVHANGSRGRAVYYESDPPFAGHSVDYGFNVTVQPTGQLSQSVGVQRVVFDRADTGARVYTVNILNLRTTYQFTRALAVRALGQYDSSRERVLSDFLGSFEPRPGTVVYVGYGSLLERRDFVDGRWISGEGLYQTTQRGLFLKASYLHRF
jgi:hypothetical protein